jgi:hypothetical protein
MRSIWQSMPRSSFALIIAAVFMTFTPIGFLVDVYSVGANSPGRLVLVAAFSGSIAVAYLYSFRLNRRFLPIVIAIHFAFTLPPRRPVHAAAPAPLAARCGASDVRCLRERRVHHRRLHSYVFFRREGTRYFRAHAEIELAHAIHQLLVPRIDRRIGRFDFYGVSLPSGEVGGDLIDLVATDGRWIGYIADVSGHGVGSGVLMGMVKSAARMKLLTLASPAALLDDLNDALVPLRKPGMFVTMACLQYDGAGGLEFSLAGHLPVLHYQAATGTVEERSVAHVPIAMFERSHYSSAQCRLPPAICSCC